MENNNDPTVNETQGAQVSVESSDVPTSPSVPTFKHRKVYKEASTYLVMLKGKRFRPEPSSTSVFDFSTVTELFVSLPEGQDITQADHVFVNTVQDLVSAERWTVFTDEERARLKRPRKAKSKPAPVSEVTDPEETVPEVFEIHEVPEDDPAVDDTDSTDDEDTPLE